MPRDSIGQTLKVAVSLCLVCSLVVSAAAVGLRSYQKANEKQERQRQILVVANTDPGESIQETFNRLVVPRLINLESATDVTGQDIEGNFGAAFQKYSVDGYNQTKASRVPGLSITLDGPGGDPAGIKRRENVSFVYFVKDAESGEFTKLVVPVRGYGLWSVLKGYIALDLKTLQQGPEQLTVSGITFYEHKETPGLGGEVDNPQWKSTWDGKHIYSDDWTVQFDVSKVADTEYEVSALTGATITSNGVANMMTFWFGQQGFRDYLQKIKDSGVPEDVRSAAAAEN